MKKVGIIMGSDSDLPIVQKGIDKLKEYGVPFEVWRSLRSAMADEHLPYAQDDLFFSMGEKKVMC